MQTPEREHQPARILVIEDSPADILLLRHALDEQGDEYEIQVLKDGAQALQFVALQRHLRLEPKPCVIVLDLHLPKHDGLTVLEAIRHAPALVHLHVVALSSYASPHDEAEIRALGVTRYCEKPLNLDGWITLASDILAICRDTQLSNVLLA
jgi:two-component system, chemotaxis family, response regulator Rcp1